MAQNIISALQHDLKREKAKIKKILQMERK